MKGVNEAVCQHGVDEFHLSHFDAAAQIGGMRGERHRFLAARDDDLGVAAGDLLQPERNRAQAAAAHLIDTESRLLLGNASLHRRLARRVLALCAYEDLSENHLVHLARVDLRRFESALDGDRAKVVRRRRAEGAVERPHRGSSGAGDDNLRSGHVGLPLEQNGQGDDRIVSTRSVRDGATVLYRQSGAGIPWPTKSFERGRPKPRVSSAESGRRYTSPRALWAAVSSVGRQIMRVGVVLVVALLPLWASPARAQQQPAPVGSSLSLQSQPPTTIAYPALNSQPFGTEHFGGDWGGARPCSRTMASMSG